MQSRTERDMAWFPVNQQVVLFQPIVSKNYRAGRVEQGYIECQSEHFTSRKVTGSSIVWVMIELQVPSKRRSLIGGMVVVGSLWCFTNFGSMKQWDDLESMRALIRTSADIVRVMKRESGSERAAVLSQTNFATWWRSTQSSDCGASWGLLTIFLTLKSLWTWRLQRVL